MPGPAVIPIALGVGQILSNVFGNLFGANKQAGAAQNAADIQARTAREIAVMEQAAMDRQLAYLERIDQRDYQDWLAREARDRRDWEASEQRRAPFRALADSAVRTLADYMRVPGMQAAQEVPVQIWTHEGGAAPPPGMPPTMGGPVSSTMPVGGANPILQVTGGANGGFAGPSGAFRGPQKPQRRTLADFAR